MCINISIPFMHLQTSKKQAAAKPIQHVIESSQNTDDFSNNNISFMKS